MLEKLGKMFCCGVATPPMFFLRGNVFFDQQNTEKLIGTIVSISNPGLSVVRDRVDRDRATIA